MSRAITIVSKVAGFRRCGMAHPDTAVTHKAGTFTDEQIARLEAEPMLVVTDAAGEEAADTASNPAPEPAAGKAPAKKATTKKAPAKKAAGSKTSNGPKTGTANAGAQKTADGEQA